MYELIADLLERKSGGWVHDTTWGRKPPDKLGRREKAALERYVACRQKAVGRDVTYRELFSFTLDRLERIRGAVSEVIEEGGGYDMRVIEHGPHMSIPDFVVTDKGELLISHVDARPTGGRRKYLYIRCQSLADLFQDWFQECWDSAAEPEPGKPGSQE